MNNKLSLILNAVLAVCVGVLFYLHFSGGGSTNRGSSAKDTLAGGISIAYVNTDTLWAKYEKVKAYKADLEKYRAKMETELTTKAQSIEREVYAFQEKIQTGNVSQEMAEAKEAELMQKQQNLYKLKSEYEEKAAEEEAKKNEELRKEIFAYIDDYNKKNQRYTFVMAYASVGALLVADPSLEITNEIVEGINASYTEKNKDK